MLSASNNVVAAFEAVAARGPAAIAVTGIDGSLDYRTLNARANQLAHTLWLAGDKSLWQRFPG